jgi:hypothetical protein
MLSLVGLLSLVGSSSPHIKDEAEVSAASSSTPRSGAGQFRQHALGFARLHWAAGLRHHQLSLRSFPQTRRRRLDQKGEVTLTRLGFRRSFSFGFSRCARGSLTSASGAAPPAAGLRQCRNAFGMLGQQPLDSEVGRRRSIWRSPDSPREAARARTCRSVSATRAREASAHRASWRATGCWPQGHGDLSVTDGNAEGVTFFGRAAAKPVTG